MSSVHNRGREALLFGVAAAALAVDQLSKAAVVRYLAPSGSWSPIEALSPYFSLTYVTNTGAAFGMFPQAGNIFVIIAAAVIAGLLVFYRRLELNHWLQHASLGLQLGGALGNLVDRLRLGHVVDFLDFKFWPVFNVADSCIVVGTLILAFLLLREQPEVRAKQVDPEAG